MSTLKALLSDALSWPKPEERERGEELAKNIISSVQVEKWNRSGIVIKRGCMAQSSYAWVRVHLFNSNNQASVLIEAELRRLEGKPSMTVKSRGQELNGKAPETVLEFIALVEEAAQLMLLNK